MQSFTSATVAIMAALQLSSSVSAGGSSCPEKECYTVCRKNSKCVYTPKDVGKPCYSGGSTGTCSADSICVVAGVGDDPHMLGLQGQHIDWKGEDGGWYMLLSDGPEVELSVRLSAPMVTEFPDRQLVTGFAMKYEGGHSIVIENTQPYSTDTNGCPQEWFATCLAEGALRITIDGQETSAITTYRMALPGGNAFLTASNMPAECQPYGGDIAWSKTFSAITAATERALSITEPQTLPEWVSTWAEETAAPMWCNKFMDEGGVEGALAYRGKHTVFKIETPNLTVRLHHGTNHQGGETIPDGRVLPELEFWQMNMMIEGFMLNMNTVSGMLGETARPVVGVNGSPIMTGPEAIRGTVEDYRVAGPLTI